MDFDFELRTKLFFGKDKQLETGKILSSFNAKKVIVVIGQSSVKRSGLLDQVLNTLKQEGIEYRVLEGVRPNPTVQLTREFISFAREYKPDFLLAIGGGSVIDTAKLIAAGYYYDVDCFDFNLKKANRVKIELKK